MDGGQSLRQTASPSENVNRTASFLRSRLAAVGVFGHYANGRGVPQDYAEAAKWYRKAADQGNAYAQSNLGWMYANGRGVPQDYVQAHMWMNLAAAHTIGDDEKRYVADRDRVAANMSSSQMAEAQRLAREWKPIDETKEVK